MSRRHRALVLIACAAVLLALGLFLPVLTIRKFAVVENTFSVASGLVALVREREWGLAAIIFVFSVAFPIAKLGMLWALCAGEVAGSRREVLLGRLEWLGKWSMLDVFVVALTVVAVKLGALATAEPRPGIFVFAASVMLSMLATSQMERA